MSKIKEIFATVANKIAHNAKDEQFEDYKEQLVERINKAANDGEFSLYVNTCSAKGRWEELQSWLESLGFTIGWSINSLMAIIKWDDNSLAKSTTTEFTRVSRIEFGWDYDGNRYDFVCSCCNEHSEYISNYCPHCGAKMYVPNGGKRRDY